MITVNLFWRYCYVDMKLVHRLKMLPLKSMYWSVGRFVSDRQYLKRESWYDFWRVRTCSLHCVNNKVYLRLQVLYFNLLRCWGRPPPGATVFLDYVENKKLKILLFSKFVKIQTFLKPLRIFLWLEIYHKKFKLYLSSLISQNLQ